MAPGLSSRLAGGDSGAAGRQKAWENAPVPDVSILVHTDFVALDPLWRGRFLKKTRLHELLEFGRCGMREVVVSMAVMIACLAPGMSRAQDLSLVAGPKVCRLSHIVEPSGSNPPGVTNETAVIGDVTKCAPGDILLSNQTPLFAAQVVPFYCDYTKSIVIAGNYMSCVYTGKRLSQLRPSNHD